jgi:hypothetical protein
METLVWTYDRALERERGSTYRAGREIDGLETEENVWQAIERHQDLVDVYFDDLERLAQAFLPREQTEARKKRLTIGFWAALKERLDPPQLHTGRVYQAEMTRVGISPAEQEAITRAEMNAAYQRASSRGEVLVGCGGSMKASGDVFDDMSLEQAFDSIFGNDGNESTEEDDMGPLVFECTEGHVNRRPRGKLLTTCQTKPCKPGSVGC